MYALLSSYVIKYKVLYKCLLAVLAISYYPFFFSSLEITFILSWAYCSWGKSLPIPFCPAIRVPSCDKVLANEFYFYFVIFLKFFFFFQCGTFYHLYWISSNIPSILLMFWFWGHEDCGVLAPPSGIEPAPPALESKVFTTGPLGKSCQWVLDESIVGDI